MSKWDNEPWKFGKVEKTANGYKVNSFTEKQIYYSVAETPMGQLYCNCPAYQFQHKESCKHVDAVTQFIKEASEVKNG